MPCEHFDGVENEKARLKSMFNFVWLSKSCGSVPYGR